MPITTIEAQSGQNDDLEAAREEGEDAAQNADASTVVQNLLAELREAHGELARQKEAQHTQNLQILNLEQAFKEIRDTTISEQRQLILSNTTQDAIEARQLDILTLEEIYMMLAAENADEETRKEQIVFLGNLVASEPGRASQIERHNIAVDRAWRNEVEHQRRRTAAHRIRARDLRTQRNVAEAHLFEAQELATGNMGLGDNMAAEQARNIAVQCVAALRVADSELLKISKGLIIPIEPISPADDEDAKDIAKDNVRRPNSYFKEYSNVTRGFRTTVDTLVRSIRIANEKLAEAQRNAAGYGDRRTVNADKEEIKRLKSLLLQRDKLLERRILWAENVQTKRLVSLGRIEMLQAKLNELTSEKEARDWTERRLSGLSEEDAKDYLEMAESNMRNGQTLMDTIRELSGTQTEQAIVLHEKLRHAQATNDASTAPRVFELEGKIAQLQQELKSQKKSYTEKEKKVRDLQAEILELEKINSIGNTQQINNLEYQTAELKQQLLEQEAATKMLVETNVELNSQLETALKDPSWRKLVYDMKLQMAKKWDSTEDHGQYEENIESLKTQVGSSKEQVKGSRDHSYNEKGTLSAEIDDLNKGTRDGLRSNKSEINRNKTLTYQITTRQGAQEESFKGLAESQAKLTKVEKELKRQQQYSHELYSELDQALLDLYDTNSELVDLQKQFIKVSMELQSVTKERDSLAAGDVGTEAKEDVKQQLRLANETIERQKGTLAELAGRIARMKKEEEEGGPTEDEDDDVEEDEDEEEGADGSSYDGSETPEESEEPIETEAEKLNSEISNLKQQVAKLERQHEADELELNALRPDVENDKEDQMRKLTELIEKLKVDIAKMEKDLAACHAETWGQRRSRVRAEARMKAKAAGAKPKSRKRKRLDPCLIQLEEWTGEGWKGDRFDKPKTAREPESHC